MAIRLPDGKYSCSYCGKTYTDPTKADTCKSSHDLVYVCMTREDLNRLIMFVYTKEDGLLSPQIIKDLKRHVKIKTSRDEDEILSGMQASTGRK